MAKVSSVAAGDSGLFWGADGRERERERENKGESKSGRRRSHGRYFTASASTVPLFLVLLSVEPKRRQKRQANMAQQAKAGPLLHFGETKQD